MSGNDNDINGIADDRLLSTGQPQGAGNVAGVKSSVWPRPPLSTYPPLPHPLHHGLPPGQVRPRPARVGPLPEPGEGRKISG